MKTSNQSDNHYDLIVIGSGMGGLTVASLMAQLSGWRVLVLESHFKPGGFLHSFQRKGFSWEPGVHYIGQMKKGDMGRSFMDLVTTGKVDWKKLGSPYERMVFPEGKFEVPDTYRQFESDLIERFPKEEKGLRRYFKDIVTCENWMHRWFFSKQFRSPVAWAINLWGKRLAERNTKEYLDSLFEDVLLKAILAGQWPDHGSPPSKSAFGFHCTVAGDFKDGAYFPIGGGDAIANSAVDVVKENGGDCLLNHKVKRILLKGNRAVGVEVERKGKEVTFSADRIVSNAGAATTFGKLLPENVATKEKQRLSRTAPGTSAIILYLGLKDDPAKYGIKDCNYWIYESTAHEFYVEPDKLNTADKIEGVYFSICSFRDPSKKKHSAQIVSFNQQDHWKEFLGTSWMKRGAEYEKKKQVVANALIDFVSEEVPQIRDLIEYQELSTPLSVENFTQHSKGMIYGQLCDRNRLFRDSWSIRTSVKNLYLTGTDIGTPGVGSALMTGVMTAGFLMGVFGMWKLFNAASKYQ